LLAETGFGIIIFKIVPVSADELKELEKK